MPNDCSIGCRKNKITTDKLLSPAVSTFEEIKIKTLKL
jgi:hypothetical protein